MRGLMLGWEYPPHITGGLGPACRGIARGVTAAGAELTFVVPRAHGDEDAGWMELHGLDRGAPRPIGVEADLRPYREVAFGSGQGHRSVDQWRALTDELADDLRAPRLIGDASDAPDESAPFRGGYGPELFEEVERFARRVGELARGLRYDLVHAHDWMTFPAGLVAARIARVPLVVHVHSTAYDRGGARPDPRVLEVERLGIAAAERVVCVSAFAVRKLVAHFGVDRSRVRFVHNAVDHDDAHRPRRIEVGSPPTVLFLGRVTHQKGPELFLDAAERVVAERPDVRFVMAGDGDLLARTVRRGAERGLAENVFYAGFLDRQGVRQAFERSDLFVLPSVSEPFGIAPLEAAAAGLPVLLSRQSGAVEVLSSAPSFDHWDTATQAELILESLASESRRAERIDAAHEDLARASWESSGRRLRRIWSECVG